MELSVPLKGEANQLKYCAGERINLSDWKILLTTLTNDFSSAQIPGGHQGQRLENLLNHSNR